MDNDNLNVSHLAWCELIALNTARQDGMATSPAQDNLFLTRWLATAEKQRRPPRQARLPVARQQWPFAGAE